MKRTITAISLLIFLSSFLTLSFSDNFYRVPIDFPTIPDALNACSDSEWDEIRLISDTPYPPFSIVNKKKVRIIEYEVDGKIVNPYANGGYAIHIANSEKIEIIDLDIRAEQPNGHGILAYNNTDLKIINNIIDCRGWGIYISQNNIPGNIVRYNYVQENTFYDCKYGIVIHRLSDDHPSFNCPTTDNAFYNTIYSDFHLNSMKVDGNMVLDLELRNNDFIDSHLRNLEAYNTSWTELIGNFHFSTPYPLWISGTSGTVVRYSESYFMFCNDRCTEVGNGARITEVGTQNDYWKCNDY